MDKYVFHREIGSGSFGKVFLIESKQTGIQYVLKRIDLNKLEKKEVESTAQKEVEVLSKLKHNHVVQYKESYETNIHLNIIMEYCEGGDLHKRIKEKRTKKESFTDVEILDYFVQITLALEYIHGRKILHRDLKTKNIFLTKGNLIKLGDFGVAKVLENSFELASTCIGSPYYISPEICENKPYNKKSDIWALGCVLYELSTLKYAFITKNVKTLISKITTGSYNPIPPNVNAQIRSLLINLLKSNPKDRPTATEILSKPFLQKHKLKYVGVNKKRSRSGEGIRGTLNNHFRLLSTSCNDLNNKLLGITAPETKYGGSFLNNKLKFNKKWQPFVSTTQDDQSAFSKIEAGLPKKSQNFDLPKVSKLPEVDSEYYNVIAKSNLEKRQESCDDGRRKWMANTSDKNELLAVLSEAELIDVTIMKIPINTGEINSNLTADDLLRLNPSEMSDDVLQPVSVEESSSAGDRIQGENYLNLLKCEINGIKERFCANNRNYDVQDLMRLTENSRRILQEEMRRKYTGDEYGSKSESESVYFDLELKRMQLEKTVGFNVFLMTYRKMIDMLNENMQAMPSAEEPELSGSETYVIREGQDSGDQTKPIESTWMTIIDAFGTKKEYIPDIWECAVRESVYYEQ